MIPLAIYVLKVTLISGILFGYYALALRNERFHQWNRYYLLLSAVISLLLPFARWSALFSGYGATEPVYVARLQAFTFRVHTSGTVHSAGALHWMQWAGIIYALMALSLIVGIGSGLLKIYRRVRQGEKQKFTFFTLVRNRLNESPFSFFRFIFWNGQIALESEEGRHILRHELVHVQEKHSVDKLLMEVILALFWVNPFFYLIRRELHVIHEFIADRQACQAEETQRYATLLVKQALRTNHIIFASHFFQRQLRRRVHMLIRENKTSFTWLRRVMAVPLALFVMLFFLFLQSQAKEKNLSLLGHVHEAIEKTVTLTNIPTKKERKINPAMKNTATAKKAANPSYDRKLLLLPPKRPVIKSISHTPLTTGHQLPLPTDIGLKPGKVFTFVEQMPQFPGGESALMSYLHQHIHYPRAARENGIQGTIVVRFIVSTTGELKHITTIGPTKGGGLETEAINVVKSMPHWIPGRQNGRNVTVQYSLPVRFLLGDKNSGHTQPAPPPPPPPPSQPTAETNSPNKIFAFVEQMPQFPGGESTLMQYLHDHIHYPANARENGIQGTVVVQFVVNTDGSLSDISTTGTRKGGGLEEEAMRVVKGMPDWQPGMQGGKKVTVQYSLPVRFILQ